MTVPCPSTPIKIRVGCVPEHFSIPLDEIPRFLCQEQKEENQEVNTGISVEIIHIHGGTGEVKC